MEYRDLRLKDLDKIASEIIHKFPNNRIFLLDAPMGAGKTTLIRRICQHLGVDEEVTSPTFAIANVYIGESNSEIYHFDFYRLDKPEDAFQIGFFEYLDSGNYCFLEWPDLILPYLEVEYVKIKILQKQNPDLRDILVSVQSQ